ncbi:MAG TPA: YfiR family protein [Rhodanobacteraceae bacterium]|nr:YfiR family protein [Rhodanobacteraceae bacterium]
MLVCAADESFAQPSRPRISLEYAVKATYLYKFAPFVNWPPDTFTAANAPFRICVVGVDPFEGYLEKAVAGRSLGTHSFVVRHMDAITSDTDCQIVFISHLQSQSIGQALDAVRGKPVLTVTDSTADPNSGSIMQFVVAHGRVRFDVNSDAAARNHLTISSKLLSLAIAVETGH